MISNLILLGSENMFYKTTLSLILLRFVLWPSIWLMSWLMFHMHVKMECILYSVLLMTIRLSWFSVIQIFYVLTDVCLVFQSATKKRMLNSPIMIVDLSTFLFNYIRFCFSILKLCYYGHTQ